MAKHGHAPSRGEIGKTLSRLGEGRCPDCWDDFSHMYQRPELQPGGNSSYICPRCEGRWAVAGGVP